METQLEIFPTKKHIPDWLAEHFHKANAGVYDGKQYFYDLKCSVLTQYGEFLGCDHQIIEKPCHSCNGTGVFKKYAYDGGQRYLIHTEPCWNCSKGVYCTKHVTLYRYLLNGATYHIPQIFDPEINHLKEIRGIIKHDPVDPGEAYRSYLILLWKYDKEHFYEQVKSIVSSEAIKRFSWLKELISTMFRKDNEIDDLPF